MNGKFRALRFIGSLYKILGVLVAILTLIAVIGICITSVAGGAALQNTIDQYGNDGFRLLGGLGGAISGLLAGIVFLVNGGLIAVSLYAIGEGIYLLLSIEANSRIIAEKAQAGNLPEPS